MSMSLIVQLDIVMVVLLKDGVDEFSGGEEAA
jgi:hypothetical protein